MVSLVYVDKIDEFFSFLIHIHQKKKLFVKVLVILWVVVLNNVYLIKMKLIKFFHLFESLPKQTNNNLYIH